MRGSISIHALTRSATAPFSSPKTCQTISIHALTRSATHLGIKGYGYEINFNPRTHKECDLFVDGVAGVGDSISIHALTRSATPPVSITKLILIHFNPRTHKECDGVDNFGSCYCCTYFNPRTHKECDLITLDSTLWLSLFQSTHSQGVRPHKFTLAVNLTINFNPRTHKECDAHAHIKTSFWQVISIHALTRSATALRSFPWSNAVISIHALTRSATPWFA